MGKEKEKMKKQTGKRNEGGKTKKDGLKEWKGEEEKKG